MKEIWRGANPVDRTYVEAVLNAAEIEFVVLDAFTASVLPGFAEVPTRVMVLDDDVAQARRLLAEAGVAAEAQLPA